MSYEESQEELFNFCLSELESQDSIQTAPLTGARFPDAIPNSIFHLTNRPEDALLLAQICINCTRGDVIKVMKSGIFHKGGLKGKPLSRSNQDYEVYYFKDLVSFILMATSYIVSEKRHLDGFSYYTSLAFDRAINQMDRLKLNAAHYRGSKRARNNLTKMKQNLEKIKSELLAKPFILPSRFKEKGDCVDSLIRLFKRQLPPPPPPSTISDNLISKAIFTLLDTYNIAVEPSAIRMRMTRAERK